RDPGGDDGQDEHQGALHHLSPFSIVRGCPMPISSAATIRANGTPAISFASLTSSGVAASNRQKHESSSGTYVEPTCAALVCCLLSRASAVSSHARLRPGR